MMQQQRPLRMALALLALLVCSAAGSAGDAHRLPMRRSIFPRFGRAVPRQSEGDAARLGADRPSSADCEWTRVEQPLDHFARGLPSNAAPWQQRVCIMRRWATGPSPPILFYAGNESPVEEYVNNTGLMYDLAAKLEAFVVFAEHRFFGESIPHVAGVENCMAFVSSAQALADYAMLVPELKARNNLTESKVVVFGGSYGGMLAAWMRMKYPNVVDGAISASAPIWAFPLNRPPLDGAAQSITYSASKSAGSAPLCTQNFLAAWVVMRELGKHDWGRQLLSQQLDLCHAVTTPQAVERLIQDLQSPLFNIAEGDYPFPSDYITFALTGSRIPLPAWPMRVACSNLATDWGVAISGSPDKVQFSVGYGSQQRVRIAVNWNTTSATGSFVQSDVMASGIPQLLAGVKGALGVWYNFTGTEQCLPVPSAEAPAPAAMTEEQRASRTATGAQASNVCQPQKSLEALDMWDAICCNEGLQLIQMYQQGVGRDMFWPPNVGPNVTEDDMINAESRQNLCADAFAKRGLYGFPATSDPWARWMDAMYGGKNIAAHSNIVFSNGQLDPWSLGGVTESLSPTMKTVLLPLGAHHLDLFFADPNDPPCAAEARSLEEQEIRKWIGRP
eukprot:m.67439 g.67439  ORF g.67439 m.67439 type:complete len:617 (-) comp7680_c0_seq1:23-1873(-)